MSLSWPPYRPMGVRAVATMTASVLPIYGEVARSAGGAVTSWLLCEREMPAPPPRIPGWPPGPPGGRTRIPALARRSIRAHGSRHASRLPAHRVAALQADRRARAPLARGGRLERGG